MRPPSSLLLALCLASISCAEGVADPRATTTRPHVVLLIVDTLRADRLGMYGDPLGPSPSPELLPRGVVVEQRVRLLDLMPTLLDLIAVPAPPTMRGASLLPALRGGDVELPSVFFVETEFRRSRKVGVYAAHWKYLENDDRINELPPIELQPFGGDEVGAVTDRSSEYPRVVRRLRRKVLEWERDNPRPPATRQGSELSPAEIDQLRAHGYIQ